MFYISHDFKVPFYDRGAPGDEGSGGWGEGGGKGRGGNPWSSSAGSPQCHLHASRWGSAHSGSLEGCLFIDAHCPSQHHLWGETADQAQPTDHHSSEFLPETLALHFLPCVHLMHPLHALWQRIRLSPTSNPRSDSPRKWHIILTCNSERIRRHDHVEADLWGPVHGVRRLPLHPRAALRRRG